MMEPVNGGPTAARLSVGTAQGVWKAFGETQALRDVSLDVGAGECHGLVGRNGAGKSTLVAILTGLIRPDRGVVRLGAEAAPALADRATWQRLVACVYQKSMVVPSLTVAENVFLNRATGNDHGIVNWRAMRSRARQVMLDWGFDLDVNRLARDLTVEQRQVVEIARALSVGARFLILDEPTASLEKAAIERLFESIRRLKGSGVGILYISHHLEEIYEVCDRVTVLRDGVRVLSTPVSEIKTDRLVEAMVGAAPQRATEIAAPSPSHRVGPASARNFTPAYPGHAGSGAGRELFGEPRRVRRPGRVAGLRHRDRRGRCGRPGKAGIRRDQAGRQTDPRG